MVLIYFIASTQGIDKFGPNYKEIVRAIKSLKHKVADNWLVSRLEGKEANKDAEQLVDNEVKLLSHSDYVVAEITVPSFGVGYAIKQALMQRKRILCLYPDDLDPKGASEVFLGNASNLLSLEFYNKKTLKKILHDNLDVKADNLTKFNFLITPEISEYLDWAVEARKQSRSELLRDAIIKKIIKVDKEYMTHKLKKSS